MGTRAESNTEQDGISRLLTVQLFHDPRPLSGATRHRAVGLGTEVTVEVFVRVVGHDMKCATLIAGTEVATKLASLGGGDTLVIRGVSYSAFAEELLVLVTDVIEVLASEAVA